MRYLFFILISSVFISIMPCNALRKLPFREIPLSIQTNGVILYGTLTEPEAMTTAQKVPLLFIIAGSGPTDRDCNNMYMKNDAYKMLAGQLAVRGIATFRYDKRGVGESKDTALKEENLRFETYINDAKTAINFLKQMYNFSGITVLGHSEGSLIGMLCMENATQFISLAGAGSSADKIIKTQFSSQPNEIKKIAFPAIDSLARGLYVKHVPYGYEALLRKSVQPYMISWFKYNPQVLIKKIKKPVLIIQGDKDLQVSVKDAELLKKANPKAKLHIIKNMNHVLKTIKGDKKENQNSYNDPSMDISSELVQKITEFVKK